MDVLAVATGLGHVAVGGNRGRGEHRPDDQPLLGDRRGGQLHHLSRPDLVDLLQARVGHPRDAPRADRAGAEGRGRRSARTRGGRGPAPGRAGRGTPRGGRHPGACPEAGRGRAHQRSSPRPRRRSSACRAEAVAEIDGERQRALDEVRAQVADLALQAAGKVVGETMTGERERRLVEEFLAEVAATPPTGAGSQLMPRPRAARGATRRRPSRSPTATARSSRGSRTSRRPRRPSARETSRASLPTPPSPRRPRRDRQPGPREARFGEGTQPRPAARASRPHRAAAAGRHRVPPPLRPPRRGSSRRPSSAQRRSTRASSRRFAAASGSSPAARSR